MTDKSHFKLHEQDDRIASISIGNRFNIVIDNTVNKTLQIRVYPITNGEIWDFPFEVFDIDEAGLEQVERELTEVI